MNKIEKSRILWIDMAKGYGILLVIVAHLEKSLLSSWIYSFHLPLFFFLSGYVFNFKNDFKIFIKRKFISIIIPYFCLGISLILFQLILYFYHGVFTISVAKSFFAQLIYQRRFWALWYLTCLFGLNILFYFLVKICKKQCIIAITSIIFCIIGLLYYQNGGSSLCWNIDVCMTSIPFFACGYLYKMNENTIDNWLTKKINIVILFFINVIAWKQSLDKSGLGLEMFKSNYGNPIFTYISAFSGIFFIIILSKCFTHKLLLYIGENSILYYVWHQEIMFSIMPKIINIFGAKKLLEYNMLSIFTYKTFIIFGTILMLTILNFIIRKLKLNFMVGKL